MRKAKAWLLAMMVMPAGPTARVIDWDSDDPTHLAPLEALELNLQQIDQRSRRRVAQVAEPWSDIGWKANHGLIAERFSDSRFGAARGWARKHAFLRTYSPEWVLTLSPDLRDQWIASLSPAEKYDLLMGTVKDGLADHIAKFLDDSLGNENAFPGWWGLCEGAAASTMYYPEPVRPVVLRSEAYNLDIPFYAPDIKGLATMLWSRFNKELHLPESGLQCKKDNKSCFDSNPASFHASVHHFLDLSPGILVGEMDPTPVVWNFPLVGYSETYFRPNKRPSNAAPSLAAATLRAGDWANDPRARKRSPGTVSIVGVRMTISYAVNRGENPPYEGSLKRKINTRELVYELELDANGKMLGGEWVSGQHPDLLWAIPKGMLPNSVGDRTLPAGGGENGVIPVSWRASAQTSAARLTPLRRVVELLVRQSAGR